MIYDRIEHIETYRGIHPNLDAAIAAIREGKYQDWTPGRLGIRGEDVFRNGAEIVYRKENPWEYHEKYLDIHISLEGSERIRCTDREQIAAWSPYDEQGDCATAPGTEAGTEFRMEKGSFLICFPQDAHMPGLGEEGKTGRKLIFKVRY